MAVCDIVALDFKVVVAGLRMRFQRYCRPLRHRRRPDYSVVPDCDVGSVPKGQRGSGSLAIAPVKQIALEDTAIDGGYGLLVCPVTGARIDAVSD